MSVMKCTAAGDAMIFRQLPGHYEGFEALRDFIAQGELRFLNLETTIHNFETYGAALSGGSWFCAEPRVLDGVKEFGFNMLTTANNHAMDYSHAGLLKTLEYLQAAGLPTCGTGRSLAEATAPIYLDAPGVCDDTANLAVMMVSARYFVQRKLRAKCGLLFVANSCEEGLGNLKGSRRIVQDYGSRIHEFYTFDGTNLRRVVTSAVGSHRYRVTVRTEGGHSYGAFGNRNAIYYLSSIINTIYTMKVPQKEGVKTTYNVGVIEGGTSVNTIAQEASMLCEYRSNDRECLETMRVFFEKTFEAYRAMGVEVEVELVGDRPCGGDVPQEKLDALIARADSAVRELFDAEPIHGPSSTDANIPLAAGIPAICVSAAVGRGCHTRQEEIDLDQLPNGAKLSMRLMQEYFEI